MWTGRWIVALGLALGLAGGVAFGQAGPGPGGQNGGQGGGGFGGGQGGQGGGGFGGIGQNGNFQINPQQIQQFIQQAQQQQMDNLKTQLGCSDDEFAIIQPKIEKLNQIRMATAAGQATAMLRGNGPMGQFGRMAGGANFLNMGQPPSDVQKASTELQDALDDQSSSPDLIETKLTALRAAKAKAKQDMSVAQDDLRQLLTQRQEAIMVTMGYLE